MPFVNTRVFFGKAYPAWKSDCKSDERKYFDMKKRREAFAERGLEMSFYANRRREYNKIAPWSHINMFVSREIFISENKKAHAGETTPNCREQCSNCGVIKNVGGEICRAIR